MTHSSQSAREYRHPTDIAGLGGGGVILRDFKGLREPKPLMPPWIEIDRTG
jgi:hypothetical protein